MKNNLLTEHPSEDVRQFWASEYPAMTTVSSSREQATRAGYRVRSQFDMGRSALDTYLSAPRGEAA